MLTVGCSSTIAAGSCSVSGRGAGNQNEGRNPVATHLSSMLSAESRSCNIILDTTSNRCLTGNKKVGSCLLKPACPLPS